MQWPGSETLFKIQAPNQEGAEQAEVKKDKAVNSRNRQLIFLNSFFSKRGSPLSSAHCTSKTMELFEKLKQEKEEPLVAPNFGFDESTEDKTNKISKSSC